MSVVLERRGALAVLTLDRPDAGNALDDTMITSFAARAAEVRADPGVRAVLVRGNGRNFCVGGDVKVFAANLDGLPDFLLELAGTFHEGVADLLALEVPIVSAVQGSAAGGGLSIACLGDVVVAGRSSKFVVAYTGIGLSPDGGGSWTLPRIVGPRVALELTLTNRVLDADEACRLGIVSRVVDDDSVEKEAEQLATSFAEGPTEALAAAKRLVRSSLDNSSDDQLELERVSLARLSGTPDGREGIAAFMEKRRPGFTDR